jgi:hypothetical protein
VRIARAAILAIRGVIVIGIRIGCAATARTRQQLIGIGWTFVGWALCRFTLRERLPTPRRHMQTIGSIRDPCVTNRVFVMCGTTKPSRKACLPRSGASARTHCAHGFLTLGLLCMLQQISFVDVAADSGKHQNSEP